MRYILPMASWAFSFSALREQLSLTSHRCHPSSHGAGWMSFDNSIVDPNMSSAGCSMLELAACFFTVEF